MVKLNKIYTRTGDDGTTGLADGSRIAKNDLRVEAYGDVDEANSAIGMARLTTQGPHDDMLARIQNEMFDLGADLSTPDSVNGALRITAAQVTRLEQEIDAMNESLPPLKSFVLPGGTPVSAHLHLARCIVRRAERMAYGLAQREEINPHALHYLNRLSDHLFVMARMLNDGGRLDKLWKPGQTREGNA